MRLLHLLLISLIDLAVLGVYFFMKRQLCHLLSKDRQLRGKTAASLFRFGIFWKKETVFGAYLICHWIQLFLAIFQQSFHLDVFWLLSFALEVFTKISRADHRPIKISLFLVGFSHAVVHFGIGWVKLESLSTDGQTL